MGNNASNAQANPVASFGSIGSSLRSIKRRGNKQNIIIESAEEIGEDVAIGAEGQLLLESSSRVKANKKDKSPLRPPGLAASIIEERLQNPTVSNEHAQSVPSRNEYITKRFVSFSTILQYFYRGPLPNHKHGRKRSNTIGPHNNLLKPDFRVPTVFCWHCPPFYLEQPKVVEVAGTFSQWQPILMSATTNQNWVRIIELRPGSYEYKYVVDGRWVCNPDVETVDDGKGGRNNFIRVRESDSEVFMALDMDSKEVLANRKRALPKQLFPSPFDSSEPAVDPDSIPYGQEIPEEFQHSTVETAQRRTFPQVTMSGPPILPPHLLQIILNKETPLTCEPTLLPEPNHVMLNHMYALSIKDSVMVMSTSERFRKKCVTTVLYRPVQI